MAALQQIFLGYPSAGGSSLTFDPAQKTASVTLSNGNLTASSSNGSGWSYVLGTVSKSTGKWAFGMDLTANGTQAGLGIAPTVPGSEAAYNPGGNRYFTWYNGFFSNNGVDTAGDPWFGGTHRFIDCYVDLTNNKIAWYDGSTWYNSANVSTGANMTAITAGTYFPMGVVQSGSGPITIIPACNFTIQTGYTAWA
jgi:hypothetical protein